MAFSVSFPTCSSLKLPLTLAFIIFFFFFSSFLPPKSEGLVLSRSGGRGGKGDVKEMVIGSRPPGCENKCMSCRPCMAAAVVPVHRMKEEEDTYYLLSWKCRCGNKIYQP